MKARSVVRCLFITAAFLCTGKAHAQTGLFLDEFGASCKSIAMGQAFTAVADDFSAAYYNPAGLTQIKSPMVLTVGYFYAKPQAEAAMEWGPDRYDNDLLTRITGQRSSHGAIIGVASSLDIPRVIEVYPWFKRFAFGLVFWLNLPEILSYHTGPEAYRPHFLRWDEGFALLSMAYSLAFEITPWLSVGAGAMLDQKVFTNEHNMSAINRSNFLPLPIPGWEPDEVIGTRVSIWSKAEVFIVPMAGILLKPPVKSLQDKISLGVSWRKGQKVHHGRGDLKVGFGLEDDSGRFFWHTYLAESHKTAVVGFQPTQVTMALAARPIKGLLVSGDVTWKDWSKYVDYLDERPDPSFEDTYVLRVGMEYAFDPRFRNQWLKWIQGIAVRAGYFFEPTPVSSRDDVRHRNIFDTDMDVVSTGLQLNFSTWEGWLRHSLEGYYQIHLLRPRHLLKEDDLWFGPARLRGSVWSFGVSLTTRF